MRLVATGPLGGHAVIPFVDLKMSEQKELPYLESLVGHRQLLTVYRDKLLCDVISFFQCSLMMLPEVLYFKLFLERHGLWVSI